jgi:hypothetical protein
MPQAPGALQWQTLQLHEASSTRCTCTNAEQKTAMSIQAMRFIGQMN